MTTTAPASTKGNPARASSPGTAPDLPTDTSIALVSGALSRPAEVRELPSGDSLVVIELTTRGEAGPAESIPVVWPDPPAWAGGLEEGARVVVLGRVRRRFFRAGGTTASRTELVAERIVLERQRARVRTVAELAQRRVGELTDGPAPDSR